VEERRRRGLEAYASQFRLDVEEVRPWFVAHFGERFADEAILAAGGAWNDDELSLRDRSLVVVAALIALGGVEDRLRGHVRWAVDHGVTVAELDALVALLAVYVGYARASTAMEVVRAETGRGSEASA
jgi:4-carboxymuconolactone decarboxylase